MQRVPALTIEAEFGTDVHKGRFEFGPASEGSFRVEARQRTGTLVSGAGQALDQLSRLLDEVDAPSGSIQITSSGQQAWELSAETPLDAARQDDGSLFQWGSSESEGLSEHSATGKGRITQVQVLMAYLARSVGDSVSPAIWEWGQYSDDGIYSPVPVLVEQPSGATIGGESTSPVELTLVRVTDVTNPGSVLNLKE